MKIMSNFMWASGAALMVIGLAGCGNNSQEVGALDRAGIIASVEKLGTPKSRSNSDDELALKVLGLFEQGEYKWESRTGENGSYEFIGLGFGDSDARIDRLVLNGLYMKDTIGPYVDSVVIEGLVSEQEAENWVQKLKKGHVYYSEEFWEEAGTFDARLISPHASIQALYQMMQVSDADSAAYFEDLTVNVGNELQAKADFIGWMPGEDPQDLSFRLDNIRFNVLTGDVEDSSDMALTLAQASALNMAVQEIEFNFGINFDLVGMNPFTSSYDSLVIDDLDLTMDGMVLDIPALTSGLSGNLKSAYSRGTNIPAMSLAFDKEPNNASLYPIYEIFSGMGEDNWDFSYSSKVDLNVKQDRAKVDHIRLIMEDGAEFTLNYDLAGFYKFKTEMAAIQAGIAESRTSGTVMDFEEFQKQYNNAISGLSLDQLDIYLDDNSLLEKALKTMAKNQDVSLDVARQQAKAYAMLMTLGVNDPYMSALAEDFAENAQKFVLEGGGLKFSVNPEDGFKLGAAMIEAQDAEDDAARMLFEPLNADFEHVPN